MRGSHFSFLVLLYQPKYEMGASPKRKLVVGASRSLLDPAGSETFVLSATHTRRVSAACAQRERTGFANPLQFFLANLRCTL